MAEAGGAEAAVAACRVHRPDVVLLELDLDGTDGLTLLPAMREASPGLKVVIMSASGDVSRGEAMEAGAAAVVDKRTAIERVPALLATI